MIDAFAVAYAGVLGAAVGSFLNVCISRLPREESIVSPRSHCPGCGAAIHWYDNFPILSYLFLRGRCRHCDESISLQYPLVELGTLVIWIGLVLLYGTTWEALTGAIMLSLLLAIAIIDARHYVIPDALSLGGLGAGLSLSVLPGAPTPLEAVAGAALGFVVLFVVSWLGELAFKQPAMGGGDIKMMAMVGAFLGPAGALLTIFLGAFAGSLIFGPISLKTDRLVPFGVFLAVGAAATFLVGDLLIDWYLAVIGLGG